MQLFRAVEGTPAAWVHTARQTLNLAAPGKSKEMHTEVQAVQKRSEILRGVSTERL